MILAGNARTIWRWLILAVIRDLRPPAVQKDAKIKMEIAWARHKKSTNVFVHYNAQNEQGPYAHQCPEGY